MSAPTDGATFFFMWIGFLFLMIIGIVLVFIWAIRSGQFRNQDRARYLPLPNGRATAHRARKKRTPGNEKP